MSAHITTAKEFRRRLAVGETITTDLYAARDAHQSALKGLHVAAGSDTLSASAKRAWDAHDAEYQALDELARELATEAAEEKVLRSGRVAESRAKWGDITVGLRTEPFDGLRAAEDAHQRGLLSERGAETIQALCRSGSPSERASASEWAAATSDESCLRAFSKLITNPQQGHLEFNSRELEAYQRVQAWRQDMSSRTALATGGYVLPAAVDPAIMLTNAGAISGIADAARQVTVSVGNSWRGITSAGASVEWKTENAEAADGTPAAAEVEIPLFSSTCWVQWSYELQNAAQGDLINQLQVVVADAVSTAWAAAFATGDGVAAPQGLITGLASTGSEINGGGSEVLAAGDPLLLQNALPARFSRDARFLSHIATMNAFRGFETTNGALLYPELRNNPPTMLGKPYAEESSMDGTINPAASASNYLLVYGDIAKAYVIARGIGSVMEVLPAYGGNGRPVAGRGLLVWSRVGAEVVNVAAARLLDVPTTA